MRRATALAAALVLAFATAAQASAPTGVVTGIYSYTFGGVVISTVEIDAHATLPPKGEFHFTNTVGGYADGTVSCVVIEGSDAWIAGALTRVDPFHAPWATGWAVRLHDGGTPGTEGDMAVTFIDLTENTGVVCEKHQPKFDRYMQPVIAGNLVIR